MAQDNATDISGESQAGPSTSAADYKVLLIKTFSLSDHLRSQEMSTLQRVNSPLFHVCIDTASVPDDFQVTIRGNPTRVPASTLPLPCILIPLVTGQQIGDENELNIEPRRLVDLHLQLAEQLLARAEAGPRFRLNDVNSHLVIEFGNMRRGVSPPGHSGAQDARETVDKTSYDTQARNRPLRPTCHSPARSAARSSGTAVRTFDEPSDVVHGDNAGPILAAIPSGLAAIQDSFPCASVYGVPYIDDLESLVYLQLWQTAHIYGLHERLRASLEEALTNRVRKVFLVSDHRGWDKFLDEYCAAADPRWKTLTHGLRQTIQDAHEKLFSALDKDLLRHITVGDVQQALTKVKSQGKYLTGADIFSACLEGRNIDKTNSELLRIERKCFDDCIMLLKDTVKALPG
ncbi:hypothetical protein BCV69DRAFT_284733 [Microstroma glucosiphilum]|uniref:Uncharacterized protein n=1 Tax=Pseudomicrostroma glucosiphilum TaxID=1684307 RepID=A0A316U0L8_9BASI|nr:hypothetical protein BCV69DRAFT_284733 [Pseudomicrostroma glucosiphilum]PWN18750.1 hypothetical protein BCV69DRAFT_284733 [Pseudomicrostroma glucosiphilum]